MARFSGFVGYAGEVETEPGVWEHVETERLMRGDVLRQASSVQNGDKTSENISLSHRVSVLGDAYAFGNYYMIRWVELHGHRWRVTNVEIQRPRLIFTLGGIWNGQTN